MRFLGFGKPSSPDIRRIDGTERALVFYVRKGKGRLRVKYGSCGKEGLRALTFDGVPLIRFHGDEYMCPTCATLVAAGYGRDEAAADMAKSVAESLNGPFESLEASFEALRPLFALLPDGYYALTDEELRPTNGNGSLFWTLGSEPVLNPATCTFWSSEGCRISTAVPKYLLPSQSPHLFNRERAEFYRSQNEARALAVHVEGYLCVLLDGHHKAVASALERRPVRTLVLHQESSFFHYEYREGKIVFEGLRIDGLKMSKSVLPYPLRTIFGGEYRFSEEEARRYLAYRNHAFDTYVWPSDILETAKSFPTAFYDACIEWAGDDLSDERLKTVVSAVVADDDAYYLVQALRGGDDPRWIGTAIALSRNPAYLSIWKELFILLAQEKNETVKDFFIDFLIDDEGLRPYLTGIVDDYFREDSEREA